MKEIFDFADVHTHNIASAADAVVSGNPTEVARWLDDYPQVYFSVGVHPWLTADAERLRTEMSLLHGVAANPRVLAVGETGIDRLKGALLSLQQQIFVDHLRIAHELNKPVVIHCVKAVDDILQLRRLNTPLVTTPWIWHGFRGKPQQACSILASERPEAPVYISLGERFNPDTLAIIPPDRLLHESD